MTKKRVVIITGGTGNLGRTTAKKYASMGDTVVLVDINQEAGKQCEKELQDKGYEALFIQTDISNEQECFDLVEQVMKAYGRIDVLCNNAARISFVKDFHNLSAEEFKGVLDVNLIGPFNLIKFVSNKMIENRIEGVIVNTGSISGFLVNEDSMAYSISKAGVHNLTKAAARELAPYHIRVVAFAPGAIHGKMRGSSVDPADYPTIREMHMRNRVIDPEELAEVSYFLSTPSASGINGTVIHVDDGYTSFKCETTLLKND